MKKTLFFTSTHEDFIAMHLGIFFRSARKGESSFSATASPDLCQVAVAGPDQGLDQGVLVHSHVAGPGQAFPVILRSTGMEGQPLPPAPHNGFSQPKSLSLGGGTCLGPDTDFLSPDTFTGHLRPHLSQVFWQYGCTVHSCTITAQIRDDVRYCEPQSWGENNLNSGYFISSLNIVSSHVNSCREFMVDQLGRYSWVWVC